MHTSYSFTQILFCIHSFIPEHICSHMQTYSMCVRTDIHAYIQTCMQAHRHTSIPAYSHAGIHMQVCRDMCLQMRFCKRRFKEVHHLKAVFLYRVQSLFGPVFATCRALQEMPYTLRRECLMHAGSSVFLSLHSVPRGALRDNLTTLNALGSCINMRMHASSALI